MSTETTIPTKRHRWPTHDRPGACEYDDRCLDCGWLKRTPGRRPACIVTATCNPGGCHEGDCVACLDCGTTVHARQDCYAVDCGSVCVPCGQARYGDDTRYRHGPMRGYAGTTDK